MLERLGLAWNVVRIAPERQEAKLASDRAGPAERTSSRFLDGSHPPLSRRWLDGRRARRIRDPRKGVAMQKRGITIRLGPLGLSLLAAGITAGGGGRAPLPRPWKGRGATPTPP